jgi:hypothetical protein
LVISEMKDPPRYWLPTIKEIPMGVCVKAAWLEGTKDQKPAEQQERPRENKAKVDTVQHRVLTLGAPFPQKSQALQAASACRDRAEATCLEGTGELTGIRAALF